MKQIKKWKNWSCLIFAILCFTSCGTSFYVIERGNDKIEVKAHLVDAYSTMQKCGSKGSYSCEVFRGRYWLPDHKIAVDRDIDGFAYKDFKKAGDMAPMGREKFSRYILEGKVSFWWYLLCVFSGAGAASIAVHRILEMIENKD